ncbi:FAD-dependent oxidoreductase domain-containing protein 1-like [Phlebotomus argentipes]|uniref:FAD-dependent oxidoreductase domain-containing protein 1-like n=1 Tax=Phlebotomus argentipes TaxID=94469 RepID=UPI0028929F11|nr:FAD-dependent oxidoreductase domain-containing protein 1-like [Phlebotomus argentipes]
MILARSVRKLRCLSRFYSDHKSNHPTDDPIWPIRRTINILKNDFRKVGRFILPRGLTSREDAEKELDAHLEKYRRPEIFPEHCDILIIGGGGMGSSIAYWLKKEALEGLNVVVVEKDATYSNASTALSVGGLRQQFSLVENIQMSLYGAEFIQNIKEHLGDDADVNFTPHGYLLLATEEGAETLDRNSRLQNELGARNEILTPEKMKRKFPWINTDGIALGCHGLEREGWFDPWCLLNGFKRRAQEMGAQYVHGDVTGFEFEKMNNMVVVGVEPGSYEALRRAVVRLPNGEEKTITFAFCILAAGAQSGEVARMMKIGTGEGILQLPLPVEPRKRYVYVVSSQSPDCPGLNTPLTIDPSTTYFRRDGLCGNFVCGKSPTEDHEPNCDTLDVDHEFFETEVWPRLAKRVPSFESLKVNSAWAGYYEYNYFDKNGIIGQHPYHNNVIFATGFSGHGIQQTPAVGRAVMELIIRGQYETINLKRLGFDRLIVDEPMFESNIV